MKKTPLYKLILSFCLIFVIACLCSTCFGKNKLIFKDYDTIVITNINNSNEPITLSTQEVTKFKEVTKSPIFVVSLKKMIGIMKFLS